jgi:dTDP-4-dehydrorhamnose 3,5-epimerase
VQIRELSIPDAFEITPQQYGDDRGVFFEWYQADRLREAVGHPLNLRQANASVSKRGVVRGIHFADVPVGQAKYVTALRGSALDFVIDIRLGSPTFGKWDAVLLDTDDRRAIYLAEGLGHAFIALEDDTVVSYLVSDTYNPAAEHGVNPLDPAIGLEFPAEAGEPVLSPKDVEAPTLEQAAELGLLPNWDDLRAYYQRLDAEGTPR